MRKAVVLLFALIVLVTSGLAAGHPGSLLEPFMSTSSTMAWLRMGMIAFLLVASFLVEARGRAARVVSAIFSAGFLGAGLVLLFSPTLMGRLSYFVLPFDILIFIETGVLGGISALQPQTEPAERPVVTQPVPLLRSLRLPKPAFHFRPVHALKTQHS